MASTTGTTGRFTYNPDSRRMMITGREDRDDYEFHCGDVFELQVNGSWRQVRIEHAQASWYLIGLPEGMNNHAKCFIGFKCRR